MGQQLNSTPDAARNNAALRIIHGFMPEACPPRCDIAAELRHKTRHVLKAAAPDQTRRASQAAEV